MGEDGLKVKCEPTPDKKWVCKAREGDKTARAVYAAGTGNQLVLQGFEGDTELLKKMNAFVKTESKISKTGKKDFAGFETEPI